MNAFQKCKFVENLFNSDLSVIFHTYTLRFQIRYVSKNVRSQRRRNLWLRGAMGLRVALRFHELCVRTRCVAGVIYNFRKVAVIITYDYIKVEYQSDWPLSWLEKVPQNFHWLVTLKQPNTQTHIEVSRNCNSKGVELKEEGIVNEVLKLSITGLEIAKSIHHAK